MSKNQFANYKNKSYFQTNWYLHNIRIYKIAHHVFKFAKIFILVFLLELIKISSHHDYLHHSL